MLQISSGTDSGQTDENVFGICSANLP